MEIRDRSQQYQGGVRSAVCAFGPVACIGQANALQLLEINSGACRGGVMPEGIHPGTGRRPDAVEFADRQGFDGCRPRLGRDVVLALRLAVTGGELSRPETCRGEMPAEAFSHPYRPRDARGPCVGTTRTNHGPSNLHKHRLISSPAFEVGQPATVVVGLACRLRAVQGFPTPTRIRLCGSFRSLFHDGPVFRQRKIPL